MRLMTRKTLFSAIIISSMATLASGVSAIALAGEITVALPSGELGATSYDPIRASKLNSATSLIYDRLVEQDADQSFHPHLAVSWDESADGMEWVFKKKYAFARG